MGDTRTTTVDGEGGAASVTLPADITVKTAAEVGRALGRTMPQPGQALVIQAAGLAKFDSSALAVLLALQRQATQAGATVSIAEPPERLVRLARAYGVHALLWPEPAAPASASA